jgi:hypothetical protein
MPISSTINCLLQNPSFRQNLVDDFLSSHSHCNDFRSGDVYKAFQRHATAGFDHELYLSLYYDDIEMCNPIGSFVKTHKLGVFYFSILNLPTSIRSRLENIYLLCLARTSDIKEYGINTIMQPFVDEMKQFNSGVIIQGLKIRIRLLYAIGDTPAINSLTGKLMFC